MALLGANGQPIQSYKKAAPPKLGEQYGDWHRQLPGGMYLPGGGLIQINLDRLTLSDYSAMRDHYQVNSSLTALTFMLHQIDWHIECEQQKIATLVEEVLRDVWSRLVRGLSQAFWSGYSPNILQWENDIYKGRVVLSKIKDLDPMSCEVNWKKVDGYKSPNGVTQRIHLFDGIKQIGSVHPIPVDNSLWYPLLMENGNYYGRKILRAAYTSYFFSILMHMFANRYFERFGEPVPVGRAPYEDTVQLTPGGAPVGGRDLMLQTLTALRNRSVVTLPNDRDADGNPEWTIEYLESQMRGADFERYLLRLDEEISVAIFTPLLMMRTADVGSGNLGLGHMQMYLWMLNAIANDWAEYINKYVLSRLVDYNFSDRAPRAKIVFRPLGKENAETIRALVTELTRQGSVRPNLQQLGQMAGMTLEEIKQSTQPDETTVDDREARVRDDKVTPTGATGKGITARVASQVSKAHRLGNLRSGLSLDLGHRRQLEEETRASSGQLDSFYSRIAAWTEDILPCGLTDSEFMSLFSKLVDSEIEQLKK